MERQEKYENKRLSFFIEHPYKGLFSLAIPILLGFALHIAYHIADIFFVGKISSNAIAAVGFSYPIVFIVYGIAFGFGTGITAIIAKYIGAKNKPYAGNVAEHGLFVATILGFIFSLVTYIFRKEIFLLIGVPSEVLQLATDYLQILSIGFFFNSISVMFRSILIGEGNTKNPMLILGIGTVLNLILDPVFIFYFGLGLKGAALATTISQIIVFGIFVHYVFVRKSLYVKIKAKYFKFKKGILFESLAIGLPASLAMIVMSLGKGVFNYILSLFSSDAVAGYQLASQIENIYIFPVVSVAASAVTLVGMFYGAKRIDLLSKIIKFSISLNVLFGFFIGIILYILAPYIFPLFSDNVEVQTVATMYIQILCFMYPLISIGLTSGRIMQGLGIGIAMLVTSTLRVLVISAPLAYIFVTRFNKSIEWVWYSNIVAIVCASMIGLTWLILRFAKVKQQVRREKIDTIEQQVETDELYV